MKLENAIEIGIPVLLENVVEKITPHIIETIVYKEYTTLNN
jgi:hypothetical protein